MDPSSKTSIVVRPSHDPSCNRYPSWLVGSSLPLHPDPPGTSTLESTRNPMKTSTLPGNLDRVQPDPCSGNMKILLVVLQPHLNHPSEKRRFSFLDSHFSTTLCLKGRRSLYVGRYVLPLESPCPVFEGQ